MCDFFKDQSLAHEDPSRIDHYFGQARELAQTLGPKLRLPRTTPGRKSCDWPWSSAYISYVGYMMPSCMVSTTYRLNSGKVTDCTLVSSLGQPGIQWFSGTNSFGKPA